MNAYGCLLAIGLIGLSPIAVAQRIPPPAEQALEAATAQLAAGDWSRAITHLQPHAADPRVATLLFEVGDALLTAANHSHLTDDQRDARLASAIAAFRAILVAQPDATRVRLELARAFFLRGQDRLARRHFQKVLAGAVPPQVAANVRGFLAAMDARRRWSAYGGFAFTPDTNIGQASTQRVIDLNTPFGILPLTRNNPPPTTGIGLRLFGGGEYQQPLTPRIRLRLGADVAHTDHQNQQWDHTTLRIHLGPQFALTGWATTSPLLTGARRWEAGKAVYDDLGLRLETHLRLTPRTILRLDLARRNRHHVAPDHQDLNGPHTDRTLSTTHQITPTLAVTGSLTASRDKTQRSEGRTHRRSLHLGATREFPRGWTVGLVGTYTRTIWDTRRTTADQSRRRDLTTDLAVSVLKRDFTVAGFSPRLALRTTRRRSNNAPDDQGYQRRYADLGFVRQFCLIKAIIR